MSQLGGALNWNGIEFMLSMFVVSTLSPAPSIEGTITEPPADRIDAYEMDDEDLVLGGRHVYEYDVVFHEEPDGLDGIVRSLIAGALGRGAEGVWFAFEGYFDFANLLTADIADQVYAFGDANEVELALDEELRRSRRWATMVTGLGRRLMALDSRQV